MELWVLQLDEISKELERISKNSRVPVEDQNELWFRAREIADIASKNREI